ncbi:MAG: hypothetical protein WA624_06600 [Methylocella sp.]
MEQDTSRAVLLGHFAGDDLIDVRRNGPEHPSRRDSLEPLVVGNNEGITFDLRRGVGVNLHVWAL